MFPSKAERILSRYRPIAPKPLPMPPSGSFGTDPSSTCASLDSFASSAKCKRSRKRRTEGSSSAKCPRTPKSDKAQVVSGLSNTAGASSLTQGISDGAVPLRDLRSGSQLSHLSHGNMAYGTEDAVELCNGAVRDVSEMSDLRWASYGGVGGISAPVYVALPGADAGNLVPQQGVFLASDARAQEQQPRPQLQQTVNTGYLGNSGGGLIEKDVAFMERAAASTVLPDRSPALPACGSACVKGIGYVGGGFTEMIRGITRLPTAADVQSLMQVRATPAATAVAVSGVSSGVGSAAMRSAPTRSISRDLPQRRLEHPPLPTPLSDSLVAKCPLLLAEVSEYDCKLVTLPLLPDVPSKLSSPTMEAPLHCSPQAEHPLNCDSHRLEPSLQSYSSRVEPSAILPNRCTESFPLSPSVGGSGQSEGGLFSNPRGGKFCKADMPPASGHRQLQPSLKNFMGGLNASSGVSSSPAIADGAAVDQLYLEQVYGASTDPVLLVDDCHQVLWFNKAYDRALKSSSERYSGKLAPTGPYIDPLGHPTPLRNFALPFYGKSTRVANATLWGFLKKLVIQEAELPLKEGHPGQVVKGCDSSSQLCLSLGEYFEGSSPICMKPIARMRAVVCANTSRLTTVTLESITELHMEAHAMTECLETVEARLSAGSEPAFITDCTSRVRWVNAAFKQMLGHTDGSAWVGGGGGGGAAAVKADPGCSVNTPELMFVCSAEKIPRSASAFSGRVNLEWMKGGKRRSMTVPCDVCRLAGTSRSMETWVWKFDMAVCLSLNSLC